MSNLFPNGVLTHELTYTDILILQSQLIEKIKQEFNEENGFNVSYYNHATLLRLIGDNQE